MTGRRNIRRDRYVRNLKSGGSAKRFRKHWVEYAASRPCAVCGAAAPDTAIRGHHIVTKARICAVAWMRRASGNEIKPRTLWDIRNCLPVCDPCHHAHHDPNERLRFSLELIQKNAPEVFAFATEVGLHGVVEHDYPSRPDSRRRNRNER